MAEFALIIVDEAGAPVEGALVTYAAENAVLPEMAFRTDSKGKTTIDLPTGSVRAFVHVGDASASASGLLTESGLELKVVISA